MVYTLRGKGEVPARRDEYTVPACRKTAIALLRTGPAFFWQQTRLFSINSHSGYKQVSKISQERSKLTNVSAAGQIFVCAVCGNKVEVKEAGGGELKCCNRPMNLEE